MCRAKAGPAEPPGLGRREVTEEPRGVRGSAGLVLTGDAVGGQRLDVVKDDEDAGLAEAVRDEVVV